MFTVLFVCTGNTCRSPMAERLLLHLLQGSPGTSSMQVLSAGVFACDGDAMSVKSQVVLRKYGIPAEEFFAQKLNREHVEKADLIIGMTDSHVSSIVKFFPEAEGKTFALGAFSELSQTVPDPYGRDIGEYEKCFLLLENMIKETLPKLISLAKDGNEK